MRDIFLKTAFFLALFHPNLQGRTVTKKTDWFDLQEAHLQLPSYSQPMITQLCGLAGD
jgi:hypothetical protein